MRTVSIRDNNLYRGTVSFPINNQASGFHSFEVERLVILKPENYNQFQPYNNGIGDYCWVREENQLMLYPVCEGKVDDYCPCDVMYIYTLPELNGVEFVSKQNEQVSYDELVFCLDYRDQYSCKPFNTYLACRKYTRDYNDVLTDIVIEDVNEEVGVMETVDVHTHQTRYIGFSRNISSGFFEVYEESQSSWIYTDEDDDMFEGDMKDLQEKWRLYDSKVAFRNDVVFFEIFGFERNDLNDIG